MLKKLRYWWRERSVRNLLDQYRDFSEHVAVHLPITNTSKRTFIVGSGDESLTISYGFKKSDSFVNIIGWLFLLSDGCEAYAEYADGSSLPRRIRKDLIRIICYHYIRKVLKWEQFCTSVSKQADNILIQHWSATKKDPMLNVEKN